MNKILCSLILITSSLLVNAQNVFTLENAIEIALENNNTIKIAKKTSEIAKNNATMGNAGYAPVVTGSGSGNLGVNNSKVQFANAPESTDFPSASSLGYNAGVQVSYTVFGGFGAKYNFSKLKTNRDAASLQERLNIENTLLRVSQLYYSLFQTQINLEIQKRAIDISKERLYRAKVKKEIAGGSRMDYLNAQVDFNTDNVNFINAENNFRNALFNLKQVLNTEDDFTVDTNLVLNKNLNYDELKSAAEENNSSVLNSDYNVKLAQMDSKISRSVLMPRLSVNGSYNFNHSENEASVLVFSENSGVSGNVQLSIPIWDGHKRTKQYQATKTNIAIAELNKLEVESVLNKDLEVAFSNYQNAKAVSNLDKINIETAQVNFERSNEMFKVGQINNTQFRAAQLNLLRVESQASMNRISIKLAEVELMRLSGQLLN